MLVRAPNRVEGPTPAAGWGKAEGGGRISCRNGTVSPGEYLADGEIFHHPLSREPWVRP